MDSDTEIFKGKTFSSLVKDIYFNSNHKKEQINQLIKDLREMVKDIGSATVIAPMIKDYIDVGVKNDDQLVKLSAVLTRFINGTSTSSDEVGGSGMLTDSEKEELLNNVKKELNDLEEKSASIDKQIKQSKDGIQ
jgi:protein subunit release factor A